VSDPGDIFNTKSSNDEEGAPRRFAESDPGLLKPLRFAESDPGDEWQHRQDAINWWASSAGPYGVSLPNWFAQDWDTM
jgi:hypothetical protein